MFKLILGQWKAILIAAVFGAVVGGIAVHHLMMAEQAVKVVKQAKTVVAETAKDTVQAVEDNQKIVSHIDTIVSAATATGNAVVAQMKTQPPKEVIKYEKQIVRVPVPQTCPAASVADAESLLPLSVASVRLLNDQRAGGETVDSSRLTADDGDTLAGITVAQFVGQSTVDVGKYNALVALHNDLVTRVKAYMQYQSKAAAK